MKKSKGQNLLVCNVIKEHFGNLAPHDLITSTRVFPATARLDLQAALITLDYGSASTWP